MNIYRNLSEIQRKEKLGRRLSLAGLVVLFVGLLVSFTPNLYPPDQPATTQLGLFMQRWWIQISFAALPAGFILASLGSYFVNRFARRRWPGSRLFERPDEVFERNLKGFDDKYAFFVHSLPGVNYAISGPCGLLLFAVRSDRGKVRVNGDRWREPFSLGRIFTVFAREGLGNPARELADTESRLRAFLQQAGGDLANAPISGAAVFLNPLTQIDAENPNIPPLRVDQVKEHIRRKAKEVKLATSTARALNETLVAQSKYQGEEETT